MKRTTFLRASLALVTVLYVTTAAGEASGGTEAHRDDPRRVSVSLHFATDGRRQSVPDRVTRDEHAAARGDVPQKSGTRRDRSSKSPSKSGDQARRSINTDFWFYTADVELFGDHDNDGYYHGIDLLFDADTLYADADVYAVLYLSRDGGPWLEYAATDVFGLYGSTGDDDYVVVTELVAGYPSGSYDILIELWDTWDDSLVAEYGPADTSALAFLPLEDTERDQPNEDPGVIIVENGGGGLGLIPVLALFAALLRRVRSAGSGAGLDSGFDSRLGRLRARRLAGS